MHGGGLDVQHHPVDQRLGARHEANPQAGGRQGRGVAIRRAREP